MLAVAVLVLTVVPRQGDDPIAVSSTSGPGSAVDVAPASLAIEAAGLAARLPLVTPIGDDGMAVATSRAIVAAADRDTEMVDVQLVTGHVARALVVDRGERGGIAWVALGDEGREGLDVARRMPRDDDVVAVLTDPPMLVEFAQLPDVEAADGTPVVDDDGDVVGLCIDRDDTGEAEFTPIDELVDDAAHDVRD
jgi:hypothetical protein